MPRTRVVDIESLERFTDSIGSASQYLIQDFSGALFHYTDLMALKGILENHDLWLSNARYSNDEREMSHGYDLAKEVIEAKRNRARSEATRSYYDRVQKLVGAPPPEGVYISCFCTEDDLLSQWRAYGENGTGVSVEFRPFGFAPMSGADLPVDTVGLMRLWAVFYDAAQQRHILSRALEVVPDLNPQDTDEGKARKTADAIHFFMPTFKDPGFEGEKERRLIFSPSARCVVPRSYRVSRGMLVPYYSLKAIGAFASRPDDLLPLTGVRVGPSPSRELNRDACRMLLDQAGYAEAGVESSQTPYRG